MDFARPCCLLFFTFSSSHTPNLSLSPPKRRQDSSAKIASLNMPITYTFVICRSDCWANAHVHTSLSHKRNSCTVCHACMNNESTPQQRWSYWHPHICRACCACASHTELVFVLRDHLFHKSRAWNIHTPQPHHAGSVGTAHTWSSAQGSRSLPKRKTGHQWLFTAYGSIGQGEKY